MTGREVGGPVGAPAERPSTSAVATLFPGTFAMVMATGILAVGAAQQDLSWLADALYAVAAAAYVALLVLSAMRLVRYWSLLFADLTGHAKGFAFLTTVAATNVLGGASIVIHGWGDLAWGLWWVGVGLWVVLLYPALIATVVRGPATATGVGINGTWFLLTVSTESIAVTGALLLPEHPSDLLAFACLGAFGLGIVLYLIVITLMFQRWALQDLDPVDAGPSAWIAAGAVAITVLAGANLLLAGSGSPRLERVAPFIEGMVTLAWATATFWFPLLVAIGVWRHVVRRVPLVYHPAYWSLVFPLAMYGAATHRMIAAVELEGLDWLPEVMLGVALVAWTTTAFGLAQLGASDLRARRARRQLEQGGQPS